MKKNNIVLIGMPGCGKSTIGVILAKHLGYNFIDTDLNICQRAGKTLSRILLEDGYDKFIEIENEIGLSIETENTVIATGGSMVLSKDAMLHLKENAIVVYLQIDLNTIKKRIAVTFSGRGVATRQKMSIEEIYEQRKTYYEKYADVTINCVGVVERNVELIENALV